MSVFIWIGILVVLLYIRSLVLGDKPLTVEENRANRIKQSTDKMERAKSRMPKKGFILYHIAPLGADLEQGFIGVTDNYELTQKICIEELTQGTNVDRLLQAAWHNKEFTQDDFRIIEENLSGRDACDKHVELRPRTMMGWNDTSGGWAWNDSRFTD